jgi:hypothetical protein
MERPVYITVQARLVVRTEVANFRTRKEQASYFHLLTRRDIEDGFYFVPLLEVC